MKVWDVEETNGNRIRVIIEDNKVIYEHPQLDGIGTYIDMMKVARNRNNQNE